MASKFYEEIKDVTIERQVENVYEKGLSIYFPNTKITYPFACDGLLDTKTEGGKLCKLIIEYKLDELLSNKVGRAKVLIQVLFYLKKFEQNGEIIPNVCLVGDKNECFVIQTNELLQYLDEDVDWDIAPSNAHIHYPDLVLKISENEEINPFIFHIDENFSFKDVAEKIKQLADDVIRYVRVTEHNIANIYDYFCKNVIKNTKKISAHDLVGLFIGVITDKENYYQHPSKKNILVANSKNIDINGDGFASFFKYFDRNYTPQEKNKFAEIADRLIEDTSRRNSGDFWTPTIWVDYAHKMISEAFGNDWKDEYVVWDNCYDKETEFLSQEGWKKISEYNGCDLVMQYNNGNGEFVKPLRYISQKYTDDWVVLKGSQLDIKCTKDHNFVVFNDKKDRNQDLIKIPAVDLYNKSLCVKNLHFNIPKTFNYNGNLDIDENLIRLAIAINADGYYAPKTTLNNSKNRTSRNTRFTENDTSERDCYVISVKKDRKSDRLRNLLENANIEYKFNEYNGYKNFTFHFPFNPKHFPKEWYKLSNKSKEVIIDEIFYWDGSVQENIFDDGRTSLRKSYSTSKKDDADFISFVFSSMGYGVNFREDRRKNKNNKVNYLLAITGIKSAKISNTNNVFTLEKNEDGMCYCFEVPSGMLIIRRNGKIYIGSNCCGSKNLTRDYKFKELYCSTLFDSELEIGKRYNQEATSFQFDFLNDDIVGNDCLFGPYHDKLPKGLKDALMENKKIIFFLNPPYGTGASGVGSSKESGTTTNNYINNIMNNDKIGGCSENLYAQFLYRIMKIKEQYNLTNCHIAIFSPTLFLTGSSYKIFRKYFLKEFSFKYGLQFKASEFADVADTWGISFSIWDSGETIDKENFMYVSNKNENGEIICEQNKYVYNTDNRITASEWCKSPIKKLKTYKGIALTSGLSICPNDKINGSIFNGSFGYFLNGGNNIDKNWSHVALFSSNYSNGHGHGINDLNFDRVVSLFSARKLIEKNWINSKDEYLTPNVSHSQFNEFVNDSIIYSLFHSSSNQSSLRQVEYKDKLWDIKNEFFWMSKSDIEELANEYNLDDVYNDARTSNERFVYEKLKTITLSPEAQAVLDKAIELTKKSFKYREMWDSEHPEYQLTKVWDAGYYQLKGIWEEYMKDDFEDFKKLYKALSDKMRPQVYELGFLRK